MKISIKILTSAALLFSGSAAFAQTISDDVVVTGYIISEALDNLPGRPPYFRAGPLEFKNTSTSMLRAQSTAIVWKLDEQVEGELHIPRHVEVGYDRFEIEGLAEGCLSGCNMTAVNVPKKTRTIPANCFSGCQNLATVLMWDNVTFIEAAAFRWCGSLGKIDMHSGVKYIGDFCFDQSGLEEVTLPKSLEYLGQNAFSNCKSLKRVVFTGHRISEIAGYTFDGCSALEEVVLSPGVESILSYAFQNTGLKELTLPASVNKIYSYAFIGTPLIRLNLLSRTPPATGKLFTAADQRRITLHVPKGTLADYRNAPLWKNFVTIIDDL